MPRIVLETLLKSFVAVDGKTVRAADEISLEVATGEFLTVVGPSGSGKTTLLRLIAGLESIDAGRIRFDDQIVTSLPPVARNVAMVFQKDALFPHFTARENLGFGLKLRGLLRAEIQSRVEEMAGLLGVSHCLDRKPGQLSGGERQRISLGRALVRQPGVLLLDEPLSQLDEPLRLQLRGELLALRTRFKLTVIYVTHDQGEALALGDRVAVMRHGRLQQVGPPAEIYAHPTNAFVAGFIGAPPMNFLAGKVVQRDGHFALLNAELAPAAAAPFLLPLGGWRADWFAQNLGRQVLLGIRPEHLHLEANPAAAGATLNVAIQSSQFHGAETVVGGLFQGVPLNLRSRDFRWPPSGQIASVGLDWAHVLCFDAATGLRLF